MILRDWLTQSTEFEVPCHRLDSLINYFQIAEVDMMTVDIEGSELTALMTFPFDRVKPRLIAVEILLGNAERDAYKLQVTQFLESKGYKVCKCQNFVFATFLSLLVVFLFHSGCSL